MSDLGSINFVKGSLRYKGAVEEGIDLTIPLSGKIKELDEFERNISASLGEVYNMERQKSTLFVPTCKFQVIFSNSYTGLTQTPFNPYPPFNNNLYYFDELNYKQLQLLQPNTIAWAGYPQYNEFNFIRTDYNIEGYTAPPQYHVYSEPMEATRYNWYFYLTYANSSDDSRFLQYEFSDGQIINWQPKNGIPYQMTQTTFNGKNVWKFKCPVNHNLKVGEYVELDFDIQGVVRFQVYTLGDEIYGSEDKIFNILDVGFPTSPSPGFGLNNIGQFKRIVNNDNPIESKSEYYVRKHKVLTNYTGSVVTNSGFEQNAFRTTKKYESKELTPNFLARTSIKEGSQSYNISFQETLNINGLYDNKNRPISELFVTVVNRGYFGYFNKPFPTGTGNALKEGWAFNISSETTNWWNRNNINSEVNLGTNYFSPIIPGYQNRFFWSNDSYEIGDEIYGDLCEWNNITQQETVISKYYQKFTYNPDNFNIGGSIDNPLGYYYNPHYNIKIKDFSDYIEESSTINVVDIPNYAYYSQYENRFIWRDMYSYGFIDSDGNGVDYPFMNNKHYPYENFIFRIIPEGSNITQISTIEIPIIDDCE